MALESRRGGRLEDPGAELLDRVSTLWAERGQMLLIGVGVIVLVGAGLFFMQRTRHEAEEAAAARVAEANILFWQGDYVRSLDAAKQVSEQYANTKAGVDAYRLAGDNSFWMGDYKAAIEAYRTYLSKDDSGMLADAVRRSLAYTLETDGQNAEAAELYMGLVGKFDRESDAEFLTAAARSYQAAGQPQQAKASLERLVNEYGETTYARRGREMLAEIELAPAPSTG